MEKPVAVLTPNFEIAANRHDQSRLVLPEKAMRHIFMFFFLALFALPLPAAAGEAEVPNKMQVLVSELDETDIACGLDTLGMEAAAKAAMRFNRIEIETLGQTDIPILGIRTLSLKVGDICVTQIGLAVYQSGIAYFPQNEGWIDGLLALSTREVILSTSSRSGEHRDRVNATVKSSLDEVFSQYFDLTITTPEE